MTAIHIGQYIGELSVKITLENQKKKRKCGNKRHFYIKLHLKDCFGMEFTTF